MGRKAFEPFRNESDCLQIDELTIENRCDRVSIFGSIDITRDKRGLAYARQLHQLLGSVVSELERADLPVRIAVAAAETVDNPFA